MFNHTVLSLKGPVKALCKKEQMLDASYQHSLRFIQRLFCFEDELYTLKVPVLNPVALAGSVDQDQVAQSCNYMGYISRIEMSGRFFNPLLHRYLF